jgi:hypothetical protein
MIVVVLAAAAVTALAVYFFFAEGESLAEDHARARTHIFNAARWAFVIALTWVLIPGAFLGPASERAVTILGLALLIGALMLIPLRWFVRLGGREPIWELRQAKIEVARLANKTRRDPGSVSSARLSDAMGRIRPLRTPETSELCDLLGAQLEDLSARAESWNEAGRRSIRIDQLSRELWPDDMPAPEHDADEATFRWHLYRVFGRLIEMGALDRSPGLLGDFRRSMAALDEFRRSDTGDFIDAVQRSAGHWAADPSANPPWIGSFEFETLGPGGLEAVKRLWGRDTAMWGASLDDDDLRAIEADLARRAGPDATADATGTDRSGA